MTALEIGHYRIAAPFVNLQQLNSNNSETDGLDSRIVYIESLTWSAWKA